MAHKVKVPLKIKDIKIMTIEDLREHFDYNSILEYYQNGKLETWLKDRGYEDEAQSICNLPPPSDDSDELMKKICEILGVEYSESKATTVSMNSVAKKNNNYERLKQYTADDEILKNVDKVAFSQEELLELFDNGEKEIYLCGEDVVFSIPVDKRNVKYIGVGVNKPCVKLLVENISEGIEIENVRCDAISTYAINFPNFKGAFLNNPELGYKLLKKHVDDRGELSEICCKETLEECERSRFGTDNEKGDSVYKDNRNDRDGHDDSRGHAETDIFQITTIIRKEELVNNQNVYFNIKWKIVRDAPIWKTISKYKGWAIQKNLLTEHCRIIDSNDNRMSWGTENGMKRVFNQIKKYIVD
jgi:hypothetical protein